MNDLGNNLIFLISQPRSGSTLTQRILGAHSRIHTQSEPWIMLHPLNALKANNIQTAYDIDLYIKGAMDFINHLPGKESYYKNVISEAYLKLYSSILKQEKKSLFLDKTPRYYYIIKELSEYFPNARFIFLWRNPAAVLSSIVQTWSKEHWYMLSEWKDDLLCAPQRMLSGINQLKGRAFVLKYEDLLKNPASIIQQVCKFLSLPFEEQIIEYGQYKVPEWKYGDKVTINQKGKPDLTHANTWLAHLSNPQLWRIIDDYLIYLGRDLLAAMGYDFDEIEGLLKKNKPPIDIHKHSLPLADLFNTNRSILVENKRLQKDLINATNVLKVSDKKLNNLNETILQKDRLIIKGERSIKQSKIEISKMRGGIEEQRLLIDKQQSYICQKQKQIEKLIAENEVFTKALSEKDCLLEKRKNETASLKLALKEKESQVQQLDSKTASLKLSLKEKESQVQQLDSKTASLKLALKEKESRVQQLDSEAASLKLALKEKESQVQQLDSEAARLKLALKEKDSRITKLNSNIADQDIKLELNESNTEKLQNQLTAILKQSKATEESMLRLVTEKKHLNKNIAKEKEKANQLFETIHAQKKEIQELKEFIKSIEQSYTFRIGKAMLWPARKITGKE